MAGPEPGTATTASGQAGRRPPLLAGGLLGGAGVVDIVTSYPNTQGDPYMVVTQGGIYQLDMTGSVWTHIAIGMAMVVAGLLVVADRRWTTVVGLACAGLGVVFEILTFPYQPLRGTLVIGLNIAAIQLLIRHRRSRPIG